MIGLGSELDRTFRGRRLFFFFFFSFFFSCGFRENRRKSLLSRSCLLPSGLATSGLCRRFPVEPGWIASTVQVSSSVVYPFCARCVVASGASKETMSPRVSVVHEIGIRIGLPKV